MIIYKSEDVERFNAIMMTDVAGQRFYCKNPRTGEDDLGFEFQRRIKDILEDTHKCPAEMFDEIWQLQETFTKVEDVNNTLRHKFDLSKKECQDLMVHFHLDLPKRESGYPMQLVTWKKYRNRQDIWNAYTDDVTSGKDRLKIYTDEYIMRDMMQKGRFKMVVGNMLDFMNKNDLSRDILSGSRPEEKK